MELPNEMIEMIAAEHEPATYPVLLTFADGTMESVEVTVKKKPHYFSKFEHDLLQELNKKCRKKIRAVKVFRNARQGGYVVNDGRIMEIRGL